jgi:O-antigen/teichoic acid export membrane protein
MKRLLINQSTLILQYAVNGLVPILLVPHVVRVIGLHDFGLLSIALVFSNYGAIVVNYGFVLSAPPKIVQARDAVAQASVTRAVLWARITLTGVVVLALAIAVAGVVLYGHELSAGEVVMLFSLPLAACLNMTWYLQALERFGILAACSIVAVVAAIAVGFLLVNPGAPEITLVAALALAIGPLLTGILSGAAGLRLLARVPTSVTRESVTRELRDGWPFFLAQAVAALYGASGVLIVGLIANTAEAGAYAAAERVANAVGGACLLVHTAAYPHLAALFHRDRPQYLRHVGLVLAIYWASAALVCLGAFLFWTKLQEYIFGSSSSEHGWLLAATLSLIVVMIFGMIYTGYLNVAGRSREVLPLTLKLLVLSLVIGVPGVWRWGAAGWLLAICCSHSVIGIVAWRAWRLERRFEPTSSRQTTTT